MLFQPNAFSRNEKIFLGLVLAFLGMRFYGLTTSPPGWYVDETNILNTICLRHTGADLFGEGWFALHRLAITTQFSYLSLAYTFPSALWLRLFGETLWTIRALEVLFSLVTVLAIAGIAKNFLGNKGMLWALALASIDPWSWALSRIAFGPSTTQSLSYLMVGLWLVTRGGWRRPLSRNECAIGGIFMGVSITAHHTFIATIAVIAIVQAGLYLFGEWRRASLAIVAVPSVLMIGYLRTFESGSGPLASNTRTGQISILNADFRRSQGLTTTLDLGRQFLSNVKLHLSPNFLFTHGDANVRHHSGMGGELSWVLILLLALAPIAIYQLRKSPRSDRAKLLFISFIGIFGGLTSASLTYESIPHANRSLPAAPFFILLGTAVAVQISSKFDLLPLFCAGLGVLFVNWYATDYFSNFPARADNAFSTPVRQAGELAQKTRDFSVFNEQVPQFRQSYDLVAPADIFWEALGTGQRCPGPRP